MAHRFSLAAVGRLVVITVSAFAAIAAIAAPRAGAYKIAGAPWPGRDVTYFSEGSAHANALVNRAARIWNRANVGVHFMRSPSPDAQVLVTGAWSRCRGRAMIGYQGPEFSWLYMGRCRSDLMVLVLAHEFGHIIGLGHEPRKCALMNAGMDIYDGTPSHCKHHPVAYWLKHPLTRDDIRGARAIRALAPG